jgi:hypothetical protein
MGNQDAPGTKTCRGGRGFAASMAASDDDDVE